MSNTFLPDEGASWRLRAADALDDLQQLGDYAARLCPDIGEQWRAAYSICTRALNHTDVALGLAKARDFAPEFILSAQHKNEPSALALWIAEQELKKLFCRAHTVSLERVLSDISYTLARLCAGGELDAEECKVAIRIAAQKSGLIDALGLAAFRQIAKRAWTRGSLKPRKLEALQGYSK